MDSVPQPGLLQPGEVVERLVYRYPGNFGASSWCRLRIYRRGPVPVVVLTERADNPGTSVINMAQYLCAQVAEEYEIEPGGAVWIEHRPATSPRSKGIHAERFAQIVFRDIPGDWRRREVRGRSRSRRSLGPCSFQHLTRELVEGFTGCLWRPESWAEGQS